MDLLQHIMITFGITAILTKGSIFEGLRRTWYENLAKFRPWKSLHTFFHCPLCVGFWASISVSSIRGYTVTDNLFFDACLASGTCWFIMMVEFFLTKKTGGGCKGCS